MELTQIILLAWNIIVALIYGLDKLFAKKSLRRISESTLITLSLILGGIGAMFGMILFNHKTSKIKFRLLIPLFTVLNVVLLFLVCKTR